MAETVKKSRIVSEDDLEESLMQEFNMRLKTCMSSDKLNDEDEKYTEEAIYENVEIITSNGKKEEDHQQQQQENEPLGQRNKLNSIEEFIQIERECLRLEQNGTEQNVQPSEENNELLGPEEAEEVAVTTDLDQGDENVENIEIMETLETSEPLIEAKSVRDRMFLSTDSASCLLFTQTVTSPMLTPSEERIDFIKGFQTVSAQNTISDDSNETPKSPTEVEEIEDNLQEDTEKVERGEEKFVEEERNNEKDERNVGEEKEERNVEASEVLEQADDSGVVLKQDIVEVASLVKEAETIAEEHHELVITPTELVQEDAFDITPKELVAQEEAPEITPKELAVQEDALEITPKQRVAQEDALDITPKQLVLQEDALDITPKELVAQEDALETTPKELVVQEELVVEEEEDARFAGNNEEAQFELDEEEDGVVEMDIKSVDLLKDVPENYSNGHEEIISTKPEVVDMKARTNPKQKYIETISKEAPNNKEQKVTECKLPCIKSLKDQYIMTATSESHKSEKNEISTLKTLDIMKQISKFEQISPGKEEVDGIPSTETTETTYVETTTVETKSQNGGQEKSLKKKKSKKSRSHEKENISVNDNCDNECDGFYNVNVKNLCRSFGDLTKIGDDRGLTNKIDSFEAVKSKAKSMSDMRTVGAGKPIENVFKGVSVKALKSSFSKFDALQKKNVLHVRSSDSSKAQEKFNGNQIDNTNCKSCGKIVFQMEQMKAEKSIWHKNCFRCTECNKQLTVDTYQSHEGVLYCKPHFKTLFAPKVVEDEKPQKPRKHELIIRENQPEELPPDVVRASDKPDLGLEELQSLNVKERFQVFEHHEEDSSQLERTGSAVNVKRSSSILSKLARFQAKGMDIGVTDDSLNGIPIEESTSEEEEDEAEGELDGEDADLIRAKRAQREKPFHFVGMSDVKSKWEQGADQNGRDERREERKQEIQSIRNRLFMGKQGKMKEAYQQAVMESESGTKLKSTETIEVTDTRSLKEKFEKGQMQQEGKDKESLESEDMSVFESGICKKSRSIFLELDANAAKAPQISPVSPVKTSNDVRKAREVYLAKQTSEEVVKSTEPVEDIAVQTADIQQRFKFFETYREPEARKKQFRITPPRDGQVKVESPEREMYRDPDVVRSEEGVEDSVIAKQTQTAKKMLNKFKQMEEDSSKDQVPLGPKPMKRFTPPPEPIRSESESEEDLSETEEESEEEDAVDHSRMPDEDLIEAQKAARAKQLRAKFEKWEANEIKREQNQSSVNIAEEFGDEQSQIESTKSLRARFESMKSGSKEETKSPRIKVNRFVDTSGAMECCQDCKMRVYPLEKISVHGAVYHKKCFKCMECHAILRMDSYSYNQGLLYCTPHFKRLFITKGNYDTAFGLEQHKEKWNTTVA